MRRLLSVLFLSLLAWAGAECVSMPGEGLVQPERVARVESRSRPNPRVPLAVQVRVTVYQGGRVVSERVSPEGYVDDTVSWNFAYQGGRLVRASGTVQVGSASRSVPPVPVERLLSYDAKGRLEHEETRSAVNGKLETVSEFTCKYSPDGRLVTENTRLVSGGEVRLVTEYVLEGQGRPLTVSLQDSLSGKLTETGRFVYVYAAPGGFTTTQTETNPFSGEVTPKSTSTFDKLGRLLRVENPATGEVRTYAYRFDSVGNWVERVETIITKAPNGTQLKKVEGVVKRTFTYSR